MLVYWSYVQQFELNSFDLNPGCPSLYSITSIKKLCTIWCHRCRFDLGSNTCPYLSICTVLRRNNSPKSWAARVCDSSRVSFTSLFEHFGGKTTDEGVGKRPLSGDRLLFDWAENISTIDLVVEADFSNSLLRCLSCFSVVDEPQPLTPRKYTPASSFQTGLKMGSSTPNCTPIVGSQSFLCIMALSIIHLRAFVIGAALIKARLIKVWLDRARFQLGVFVLIPKVPLFPLLPQKSIFRDFLLSAARAVIWARCCFRSLLSPISITTKWWSCIQLLREVTDEVLLREQQGKASCGVT